MNPYIPNTKLLAGIDYTDSKRLGHNVVKYTVNGIDKIRYTETDIITYNADGSMTLNTGGFKTQTTKKWLNTFLPKGVQIWQEKGMWNVHSKGKSYPYRDGIRIGKHGGVYNSASKYDLFKQARTTKLLDSLVQRVKDGDYDKPDGGDCWICAGVVRDGSTDCISQHINDQYLHGSLIVRAYRDAGYQDAGIGMLYFDRNRTAQVLRRFLKKHSGIAS